jgi:hypothetical protein
MFILKNQKKIKKNKGRIFYNHNLNDSVGITTAVLNITDASATEPAVLAEQRFIINVRGE